MTYIIYNYIETKNLVIQGIGYMVVSFCIQIQIAK